MLAKGERAADFMKILKKFLQYYRPYRFLFYADMFCALIVSLVDLAFPLILDYLSKMFL